MSTSVPPRFVPTLTEIVRPGAVSSPVVAPVAGTPSPELEEQIVQRVLQRVNLVLERRLRESIGQLVLEHTQSLAPQIREEVEQVVRQSVAQAFQQQSAGSGPLATG